MTGYSIATLKWGLTHRHDSDLANGRKPFDGIHVGYWSQTSGHTEETVSELMEQIKRDRETRVEPVVDPDLPCEGK